MTRAVGGTREVFDEDDEPRAGRALLRVDRLAPLEELAYRLRRDRQQHEHRLALVVGDMREAVPGEVEQVAGLLKHALPEPRVHTSVDAGIRGAAVDGAPREVLDPPVGDPWGAYGGPMGTHGGPLGAYRGPMGAH